MVRDHDGGDRIQTWFAGQKGLRILVEPLEWTGRKRCQGFFCQAICR